MLFHAERTHRRDKLLPAQKKSSKTTAIPKTTGKKSDLPFHPYISWTCSGRAIEVNDKDALVEKLLPLFFDQKIKFSSFVRKLNRWGFRRVSPMHLIGREGLKTSSDFPPAQLSAGVERVVFAHPCFCREKPQLAKDMFPLSAMRSEDLSNAILVGNNNNNVGNDARQGQDSSSSALVRQETTAHAVRTHPPEDNT